MPFERMFQLYRASLKCAGKGNFRNVPCGRTTIIKTTKPMKRSLKNTKASSSHPMGKVSYYVSIDFDEMMARIESGGHGTLLEMALIHLAVDDLEEAA